MSTILAIAVKDVKLLLRDRAGAFFVFFMPLLFGVFFGVIFSGGGGGGSPLSLAVVDRDRTPASRSFVKRLAAAEELDVTEVSSMEQAEDLVRRGKRLACVTIPKGFEAHRDRLFEGKSLHLSVGVDPSRKAAAGMLQGVLTRYAFQEFQSLFSDRYAIKKLARRALEGFNANESLSPFTRTVLQRFMARWNGSWKRFQTMKAGKASLPPGGEQGTCPPSSRCASTSRRCSWSGKDRVPPSISPFPRL